MRNIGKKILVIILIAIGVTMLSLFSYFYTNTESEVNNISHLLKVRQCQKL